MVNLSWQYHRNKFKAKLVSTVLLPQYYLKNKKSYWIVQQLESLAKGMVAQSKRVLLGF